MSLEGTNFAVVTESCRQTSTDLNKTYPSSRLRFWQPPTHEEWLGSRAPTAVLS